MATAEEIKRIDGLLQQVQPLLPELSLASWYKAWRDGNLDVLIKRVEEIYIVQREKEGVENAGHQPLTFIDVLNLLKHLDWYAPAGEFVAPPGTPVENINEFYTVAAGEFVCRTFCAREGLTGKLKQLTVDPFNLTARDFGSVAQEFEGTTSTINRLIFGTNREECCRPGVFTVLENITIHGGACYVLKMFNNHANSKAEFHVTGKFWTTP